MTARLPREVDLDRLWLLSILLLASCASTVLVEQYVCRDLEPGSPTLVIVPASNSESDLMAADVTTGLIIGSGCSVLERPSMMKQREDVDATSGGVGSAVFGELTAGWLGRSAGSVRRATGADPVDAMGDTKADYAVFVRNLGRGYWLRVVRKQTAQVLYSGLFIREDTMPSSGFCCLGLSTQTKTRYSAEKMRELLKSAGVLR